MMRRWEDSKKRRLKAALAALIFIAVVASVSGTASYLRGIAADILAPRSADPAYASLSRDALIARLADDENQLKDVKYQAVLYGLLAGENAKLKNALHAAPDPAGVLARVLSRPPRTAYDTLLVDQGSSAGIHEGDLAEYQGVALGKVVSVGPGSALVRLFSSPGDDTDAIFGNPAALSVAHGMGGGAFEFSVPQGISVASGDPVRMQGTEALLLAVVVSVSSQPTGASASVHARLPVSLSELDFVTIITPANP